MLNLIKLATFKHRAMGMRQNTLRKVNARGAKI
mgnify:CR=1 FL=1